jgi:hypothetical protein
MSQIPLQVTARAIRSARIAGAFQRARRPAEQQRQAEDPPAGSPGDDTEHPWAAMGRPGVAGQPACARDHIPPMKGTGET